ncbi:TerC family protein [Paenibacillus contaminans]|jgi:YjbE family integral membrane protein|uniref:TerC family protein n=1 Tax=Paenibacillus contaminans TaxID=450362 RepID=A0A329MJA0_9BACL|nr:TerC family protein [Paenibacillus contaminans]RAV19884.1 TerC family protein [Paenibacillus contaminans]
MEWFSAEFWVALLSIIMIDLVLAGDNAIVIGMAARNVPKEQQKKVIIWGTVGAIVIRVVATLAVAWLLKIPGLLLVGGFLLLWIAYKLLVDKKDHELEAKPSFGAAIRTIIIADAAMGMDNVLAVAGAAKDSFALVIIGLLISMPIVVWGSTLFVKLVTRFTWIIYAGSGVLAFTASKMILDEPFLKPFVESLSFGKWIVVAVVVIAILVIGKRKNSVANQPATS